MVMTAEKEKTQVSTRRGTTGERKGKFSNLFFNF
jgi:hypothetical protein